MKLYDVLREWSTDPEAEFFCYQTKEVFTLVNGRILSADGRELELNKETINYDFDISREPVSFMEAVRCGKRISVEHEYLIEPLKYLTYSYLYLDEILVEMGSELGSETVREVLLNGKFYIKD